MIHIINPFKGSEHHEKVQKITFESIQRAKQYEKNVDVDVLVAYFKEDENIVPDFANKRVLLNRSIQDFFPGSPKKLPLLNELFEAVKDDESVDYVIYSNIDIALYYPFYSAVKEFINHGYDAFVINRRRVSEKYDEVKDINQIYSEVGKIHAGYDCFVFKREMIKNFSLGNTCIGIPFVDSVMLFNLIAFCSNFKLFTDKHLTFHIGFELIKNWGSKTLVQHNKQEYQKTLKQIKEHINIKNIPASGLPFFKRHFKWLMNPTIDYRTVAKIDFKQWNDQRYVQEKNKLKGYYEWLQKKVKLD